MWGEIASIWIANLGEIFGRNFAPMLPGEQIQLSEYVKEV